MKKLLYSLVIISYLILGFILIFYNYISPDFDNLLGIILTIIVIIIWLTVPIFLYKLKKKELPVLYNDKLENWLAAIVLLPVAIVLSPLLVILLFFSIIDMINGRFYKKSKKLIKKGFKQKKEKNGNSRIYLLTKDNYIFMFTSDHIYSISEDNGNSYVNMIESLFFTFEERIEMKEQIIRFKGSDYRDADIYEPTDLIISIIEKHF